ncbi:lycopene cyclase domain-containing protein [Saccharicrinis fermentans]|uniref:Lycopene cyclase domain protein n=1 Tax=Saccharicrinis fermentans DSM 9555 = JCM 21142 TaxID=869213 RepID=W7YFH5_9BACT|nr:lycopene cyclase domain-containing protein [Saccharicrinis fermentans]GAF03191.1 lycopene cyclase domain protein [Saccharicrinis fermentans DSM 9555 = JCM 21142]
MSLYLWVLICSGLVPLLYSFHAKLKFYKYWPSLFSAIFLVAIPYLIWDWYFTEKAYWGFNDAYLMGIRFWNLPLEEILFFVVIPYCCVFTFYSLKYYFPALRFSKKMTFLWAVLLLSISIVLLVKYWDLPYALVNFLSLIFVLTTVLLYDWKLLSVYFWIFPIILFPFFMVNGVLTGLGIENEIVWYNPDVLMGWRIATIPVEDVFYAFTMVLSNLFFMKILESKST